MYIYTCERQRPTRLDNTTRSAVRIQTVLTQQIHNSWWRDHVFKVYQSFFLKKNSKK
jgi:hypothetical protein